MNKNLEKSYTEAEYARDLFPYKMYLNSLEEVFDFSLVNNFLDLGCNNGRLIEAIDRKYKNIRAWGVDFFPWAKQYAEASIRDKITLLDLAKPQDFGAQYDVVNCSEVGEHIEAAAEEVFLDNLVKATKQILILTWSNKPSHDNDQHQNPRPKRYIIEKLEKKNLRYWGEASKDLSPVLRKNLGKYGYYWWAQDIMVFRRTEFLPIASNYFIQGINTDDEGHKFSYKKSGLYGASFQQAFMKLVKLLKLAVIERKGFSIIRISDGDYFFLRKIPIGSAKPGRRALTKNYDQIDINFYRRMLWLNDIVTLSVEKTMFRRWKRYLFYELADKLLWRINLQYKGESAFKWVQHGFDIIMNPILSSAVFLKAFVPLASKYLGQAYRQKAQQIIDKSFIPMDCVYALVATKWLFRNFPNQIGIISGGPKLELIKKLTQHKEYREYLGMDSFADYIEVPQKGAADDVVALSKIIGEQLKRSQAKIFLVAVGSAKVGLMPLLKAYTDAVLIDVGCGVDALAGIVCQDRPYFADWTNFRIKDYDYSKVDFMDQNNPAWNNPEYKTQLIG